MSKAIIIVSMMIFIISGILMLQMSTYRAKPLPSEEGLTQLSQAQPQATKIGKLDILFIGNSYTFMHSMPHMIIGMATSDTKNAVELNIQSITIGGARLKEHWLDGRAATLLNQKAWDFVILQDQSNWPTFENGIIDNYAYITRFKNLAKTSNKKAIIASFKTWPKQEGSHWYKNPETRKSLKNYDYMRLSIDKNTALNAKKTNIDIVPAGDYWLYMLDNKIDIPLYMEDGSHPSVAGSYLNALIFYRYFTMSNLKSITYTPYGIKEEEAAKLREIAALGNIQ